MMRSWISKAMPWRLCDSRRTFCNAHCIFQRGQWGNEHWRNEERGQRGYGDQGDWGGPQQRGGGGGRRDYGNQGDWGGPQQRGGGGGGRRDYGNQGDWGGPQQRGGGGRRDYGDQGDWGGPQQRGGGGRRDHGDQGDWGGPQQRGGGGGRRDYGDQGDWGGPQQRGGGGRRDHGDQGDWGGPQQRGGGGGRRDHGDQGDWGGPQQRDGGGGGLLDMEAAKKLFEMKRLYKNAKSGKDRRDILREARRLIRRARVDPSTQDEKAVALLLNCAVVFRSYPYSEGIKQAIEWMRQNIEALSPQNLALFANAVGALSPIDSDVILLQEISPAVQSVFTQMSTVELVMILQAFQRGKIVSNASLQETMLRQLASCVTQMPVAQLSTLASVLVHSSFRKSDEAAWRELTNAVLSKAVSGVEKMHSREVITLLKAAPHLYASEEQSLQLIGRAIETAGFHTDEQISELFEAVAAYRALDVAPTESLSKRLDELLDVLWTRLQKVASYTDAGSATRIMRQARRCGVDVPLPIMEVMLEAIVKDMRYHRYTFGRCAKLAEALAEQKVPARVLLQLLGDYCIGKRPPRDDVEVGETHEEDDTPREVRMDIVARFLGDLTRARIALENAYSAHPDNGEPGESLRVVLPERLEASVFTASPREILKSVRSICISQEDSQFRNISNDEKIMALVEQRIQKERNGFLNEIPKEVGDNFFNVMKDVPRAKKVIQALFN